MARSETRLKWSIWQTLQDASSESKLLYLVMLTEKTVNNAGLGALRLGLWSRFSGLDHWLSITSNRLSPTGPTTRAISRCFALCNGRKGARV